jgi:hypothetical protein
MAQLQPRVRARHCQDWLAHVKKEDEPYRSRFFERVPPALREQIDSSSRVGWLPISVHVELADLVVAAFGAARAHAFYRRAASQWLMGPLLGPVLRTSARLLELTPATLLRWAHHGWEVSFKDSGELVGEAISPTHGRLVYSNLPPVCTASMPWMTSAQGSAYGVLDVIGFEGSVRLDTSQRSEGRMFVEIDWTPHAPSAL